MKWTCLVARKRCKCIYSAIIIDGACAGELSKFRNDVKKIGLKVVKKNLSSQQLHAIYDGCKHQPPN